MGQYLWWERSSARGTFLLDEGCLFVQVPFSSPNPSLFALPTEWMSLWTATHAKCKGSHIFTFSSFSFMEINPGGG
tara:strand:- start:54 stop:281 length:228 start_codon:yes stop_codon:yes gene_type:complete